jgi:hypothetical protein
MRVRKLRSGVLWQGVLKQRGVKHVGCKTVSICVLSALLTVFLNKLQTSLMKCNLVSVVVMTFKMYTILFIIVLQE